MKVKIDTKEKMHVITIIDEFLSANMSEDVKNLLLPYLDQPTKNLVINFKEVKNMDEVIAITFLEVQQVYYEKSNSMVFCNMQPEVEDFLEGKELLEVMNVTPTESEAWDIVQMEEIEREFL